MDGKIEKIIERVSSKITPNEEEKNKELEVVRKMIKRISGLREDVKALLCGSLARDTHLKGERDLDIFVLFNKHMPKEEFEKEGIKIGLEALAGYEHWLEYSEHPYVKGIVDGYEVEIVPCYKVDAACELKSSVDRSPFHAKFLKRKLKPEQKKEARLLKAFMKGVGCYGADISTEGFSGYLTELLILKYGDFISCVKAASNWRPGIKVALEERHSRKCKAIGNLVFPDPTDPKRNVASAVSLEQFARFVAASKSFLKKPSEKFFFGQKKQKVSKADALRKLKKHNLVVVKICLKSLEGHDTILGQMKRFKNLVSGWLKRNGFMVLNEEIINLENTVYCAIEVEEKKLGKFKKIVGPPVFDEKNVAAFLKKHKKIVSGPRIENDRVVIVEEAKGRIDYLVAKEVVDFLSKRGKEPLKSLLKSAKVLEGKTLIRELEKSNFREALLEFVIGKEVFF
ncbi:MAG: CCA tRNA nucleotidyltransferase [Candidatus Diapherotrites archaeon]|nr:CCA tRNA nucleotidyltransferase [Candidatus Diapherotrites archaeon]